ncbi:hypothetical protein GBA52_003976 [Prunus armeniaca]|nr:hypothetical protein GBA52_003976 [Prunus armeniaca]
MLWRQELFYTDNSVIIFRNKKGQRALIAHLTPKPDLFYIRGILESTIMNSESFYAETGSTERTRFLGLLLLIPGALILAMGCCEMSLLKAVRLLVAVFVFASTVIPEVITLVSWADQLRTWLRQLKTKLDKVA